MNKSTSFWDRRRAAVQAESEAETVAAQEAEVAARAEALAEKDDAEILAEMGLPNPETMQKGDDFAAFMSRDVPEHLRKQALRTLWRSNPVLACVDGLNDYDQDFRTIGVLKGPIQTAYQVGKGMLKHIEEVERQAQAAALAQDKAGQDAVAAVDEDVAGDCAEPKVVMAQSATEQAETPVEPQMDDAQPTPRRMRFRFEEATV